MKIGLSKEDAERFVILGLGEDRGLPGEWPRNSAAQFCAILRNSAQFSDAASASSRPPDVTAVNRAEWRDAMDLETTRKALVAAVEAKKAEEPLLRAILLESTILPYFADTLRQARKVPVFDTITLADYICMSRTDNPRFGAAFGKEDAFHRWQAGARDKAAMPPPPASCARRLPPAGARQGGDAGDRHPAHRLRLPAGARRHRPPEQLPLPHPPRDRQVPHLRSRAGGRAADRQAEGAFRRGDHAAHSCVPRRRRLSSRLRRSRGSR